MKTIFRKLLCIAAIVSVTLALTGCVSQSYRMYKIAKRQVKKEQAKAAARKAMEGDQPGQEQQAPPQGTVPQ